MNLEYFGLIIKKTLDLVNIYHTTCGNTILNKSQTYLKQKERPRKLRIHQDNIFIKLKVKTNLWKRLTNVFLEEV